MKIKGGVPMDERTGIIEYIFHELARQWGVISVPAYKSPVDRSGQSLRRSTELVINNNPRFVFPRRLVTAVGDAYGFALLLHMLTTTITLTLLAYQATKVSALLGCQVPFQGPEQMTYRSYKLVKKVMRSRWVNAD
jgi:hypothetical protein